MIGIREVAKRLGVSPMRVRQLDLQLHPLRDERGVRLYDESIVAAVATARAEAAERAVRLLTTRGFVRAAVAAARLGVDAVELAALPIPSVALGDGTRAYRSDAVERVAGELDARRAAGAAT